MVKMEKCELEHTIQEKMYDRSIEQQLLDDEEAIIQIQTKKQYKPGYQKLKKTKEYVERTYYGMKNPSESQSLIDLNLFWSSLANHLNQNKGSFKGFLTENFIYSTKCHAEMICALAFMDLSFNGGDYELSPVQGRLIQIASQKNSNLIIFLKDIVQSKAEKMGDIAVSQRIFDPIDRYTYLEDDTSVKIEKNITEYITNKVYGCQVIITNCSIADLELQILTEIPNGAIPIHSNDYTKSYTKYIQHYHTELIEYFFYFPSMGQFVMYPANVSRNEVILSTANNIGMIEVKKELAQIKLETFYDILRNGNINDILKFISEKNIRNNQIFNFSDIYWLVYDNVEFYKKYITILKERFIFDYNSWVYSLHHYDSDTFIELINSTQFQNAYFNSHYGENKIRYFQQGGIRVNQLQIFEYYPLLSSRTHNFQNQQKSKILNIQFKQTYTNYLQYLIEVPKLEAMHLIIWCYYLLLQERIDETLKLFAKIDPKSVQTECQIQYDYLSAYLDVYTGHPDYKISRQISQKYLDYPIQSWKNLFTDLHNQFQEYDGMEIEKQDQIVDSELNKNIKASSGEETYSFEIDQSSIVISYQNTKELEVNYYELDLEILFSRTPFLISSKSNDDFSYVKANLTQKLKLQMSTQLETYKQEIPKDLASKNLLIQIKGQNKVLSKNYFSTQIKVQVIENYGQIKVFNQKNQTLSKVYVKVFAKQKNGEEVFYRDGYTDMRGKFDYALSSNNDIDSIAKFALLISHEEFGSIIKEVTPPSKMSTMEYTMLM